MHFLRHAGAALALTLLVGSCASAGDAPSRAASPTTVGADGLEPMPGAPTTPSTGSPAPDATVEATSELSPLAELVEPAGNLLDAAPTTSSPEPVWLTIESIGVAGADIRDVGIEANGELEVPGAEDVGWYRWSPSPGDVGSAVLAAHIAYNGTDGVFRHLDDVRVGQLFTVGYDDGSTRAFEIVETSQYRKEDLPFDRIFAKDGEPVVTLITCGGAFDPTLRSYEDNVVAYAVPA